MIPSNSGRRGRHVAPSVRPTDHSGSGASWEYLSAADVILRKALKNSSCKLSRVRHLQGTLQLERKFSNLTTGGSPLCSTVCDLFPGYFVSAGEFHVTIARLCLYSHVL